MIKQVGLLGSQMLMIPTYGLLIVTGILTVDIY